MTDLVAIFTLRSVHIAAGTGALFSLAVPLISQKGGALHRRAGWLFTTSMVIVALSAWLMSIRRWFDADPNNDAAAYFLADLGLLSACSVWMGIRSVRLRRERSRNRRFYDLFWPCMLAIASLALGALGIISSAFIPVLFACLGLAIAIPQVRYWTRDAPSNNAWLLMHLQSMGAGGISAVTAFVVVNSAKWGTPNLELVAWIAPGALGGIGLAWASRKYVRQSPPKLS